MASRRWRTAPGLPRPWVGCAFATGPRAAEDPSLPACFGSVEKRGMLNHTGRDRDIKVRTDRTWTLMSGTVSTLMLRAPLVSTVSVTACETRRGGGLEVGSACPSPLPAPAPWALCGPRGPYRRSLLWPTVVFFNAPPQQCSSMISCKSRRQSHVLSLARSLRVMPQVVVLGLAACI